MSLTEKAAFIALFTLLACSGGKSSPKPNPGVVIVTAGSGAGGAPATAGSGAVTPGQAGPGGTSSNGAGGVTGVTMQGRAGAAPGASGTSGGSGFAGTGGRAMTGGGAGTGAVAGTGAAGRMSAGGAGGGAMGGSGGGSIPAGSWWKPTAGLSWQWQIGGGTIDPSLAVDVFDIDWEQNASVVMQLHQAGKKVICYVSVGSWENWRPDASDFPAAVLGNDYPGWPGEKFVDIRAQALRDLMAKRFDACQMKGFDALEPDNMDVFSDNSGFPLTRSDGVDYAKWLATESHNRGMAIVQKNASEITSSIQSVYDGALTEDCYSGGNWCSDMQPYIDANKPVFACEYSSSSFGAACSWGKPLKYSFILKSMDLNAPVTFCP